MHSSVNAAQRVFSPHQLSSSTSAYYDQQQQQLHAASIDTGNTMIKSSADNLTTGRRKRERPRPNGSNLLTEAENQQLFEVLGPDRISLAAGVVQLFSSAATHANGTWQKCNAGVVSLIKDYGQKCYVIEVLDVFNWESLWSQTLYKEFRATYYSNCPRFITFEGDKYVYGLNFADYSEAEDFKSHLTKRSECERNSAHCNEQRNTAPQQLAYGNRVPQVTSGITTAGTVAHFGGGGVGNSPMKSPFSGAYNNTNNKKSVKSDKKNKKKPRHRKEDISNPTDFKHLIHLGWDEDGGFNRKIFEHEPMDDSVCDILRAAGKNPDKIDNEERKFVYQFLENQNFFNGQLPNRGPPSVNSGGGNNQFAMTNGAVTMSNPLPQQSQHLPPRAHVMEQQQTYYYQQPTSQPYRNPSQQHYQQATTMRQPPPPRPPPVLGQHKHGSGVVNDGSVAYGHGRALPMPPQHLAGSTQRIQNGRQTTNPLPPPPPPPLPLPSLTGDNGARLLPSPAHQAAPAATAGAPPPPPPPPPPPIPPQLFASSATNTVKVAEQGAGPKVPQPNDERSNLLQQIQAGTKLKHVSVSNASEKKPVSTGPPTVRDNMMEQIKLGAQLKHVDSGEADNRKSAVNVQDLGGIAGALARALEERRRNLINSEDSEESDDDNDGEWEDD